MKSKIMKRAWELAREGQARFGGSVRECLGEAMRIAWKEGKVEMKITKAEREEKEEEAKKVKTTKRDWFLEKNIKIKNQIMRNMINIRKWNSDEEVKVSIDFLKTNKEIVADLYKISTEKVESQIKKAEKKLIEKVEIEEKEEKIEMYYKEKIEARFGAEGVEKYLSFKNPCIISGIESIKDKTEKAYLFGGIEQTWIPKSKCILLGYYPIVPAWLAEKITKRGYVREDIRIKEISKAEKNKRT